ncbi:MAG: AtpZ/AtpI family protein [Thermoflexales bacterium]|nr:AtpZ/AtpI family protein [Thermoflexales bacterium]MCS7323851.1 AtpZ/AtpI family protein [Thermoflexales bacterium]MCX7938864.1 AtpZ/AtpI family protein [Thermoflexales bacterium]MDW8052965.1 AtpZ/AtpI family protein [Anaerolineae bacterium]MDW8291618.1 AtpZ/AtpI family protein [Anaerolineae bacterium]
MQGYHRESPLVIFVKAFPPRIIGAMALQLALINGALMVGAVFLGMSLDAQLGSRPWLTIALPLFGALLSLGVAYRLAMIATRKSRKAYLDWLATKQHAAASSSATVTPAPHDAH